MAAAAAQGKAEGGGRVTQRSRDRDAAVGSRRGGARIAASQPPLDAMDVMDGGASLHARQLITVGGRKIALINHRQITQPVISLC